MNTSTLLAYIFDRLHRRPAADWSDFLRHVKAACGVDTYVSQISSFARFKDTLSSNGLRLETCVWPTRKGENITPNGTLFTRITFTKGPNYGDKLEFGYDGATRKVVESRQLDVLRSRFDAEMSSSAGCSTYLSTSDSDDSSANGDDSTGEVFEEDDDSASSVSDSDSSDGGDDEPRGVFSPGVATSSGVARSTGASQPLGRFGDLVAGGIARMYDYFAGARRGAQATPPPPAQGPSLTTTVRRWASSPPTSPAETLTNASDTPLRVANVSSGGDVTVASTSGAHVANVYSDGDINICAGVRPSEPERNLYGRPLAPRSAAQLAMEMLMGQGASSGKTETADTVTVYHQTPYNIVSSQGITFAQYPPREAEERFYALMDDLAEMHNIEAIRLIRGGRLDFYASAPVRATRDFDLGADDTKVVFTQLRCLLIVGGGSLPTPMTLPPRWLRVGVKTVTAPWVVYVAPAKMLYACDTP